jgi:hypothetical protein
MAGRKQTELNLRKVRSALTNGSELLRDVDHRTAYMRRLRDLLQAHEADLGGHDVLSEGQRAIIRRATLLTVQCEMLEQKFAEADGLASSSDLECYQKCSNSLRRLLESLGLHKGRIPREVNELDDEALRLYREELNAP